MKAEAGKIDAKLGTFDTAMVVVRSDEAHEAADPPGEEEEARYHPALAFSLNWAQTLMQGAGAAGVAFIGAEYLVGLLLPPERRGGSSVLLVALSLMVVLLLPSRSRAR